MRVAVLGAGAIGAYVGASLCRAGVEVHLVARGPHLAALRDQGVQVLSPRGDFTAHPNATDRPEEIGPVDHVFLGLKANAYAAAGHLVEPLLGPHTTVIGAQNGIPWWYFYGLPGPYQGRRIESVDPGGAVTKVLPLHRAVGCVVYPATVIESPGVVRHLEGTRFSIGEPDRTISSRCTEFAAAMIAGGLKCPVEEDLRNDIWIKLMGNISFNPLSALTRATMAGICRHRGTKALVATMMEETIEVARLVGAQVSVSIERRLAGAERTGEHKTSTLQDLERGRPMELDVLLTAVVELADMVGADVPTLRAIAAVADLLNQQVAAGA
ncbi:MAG: 2-dehydropantoate 2-reductase [Pseudonocardiales bacterium]|jgi:2-dehydropantoate 2-reductase|nr:2-dehydropantoate 2-reductase [Pseudonocardiales bacterium]